MALIKRLSDMIRYCLGGTRPSLHLEHGKLLERMKPKPAASVETSPQSETERILERERFSGLMEPFYNKKGMHVQLVVTGMNKETLLFKGPSMSESEANQILYFTSDLMPDLRRLGFQSVIFTDGEGFSFPVKVES